MDATAQHRRHAEAVRAAAIGRATGEGALGEPYAALARQIRDAAYRVTDAQVAAVRAAEGSDKGAFEVIMSASIGAGLARWDRAIQVIDEASDATI